MSSTSLIWKRKLSLDSTQISAMNLSSHSQPGSSKVEIKPTGSDSGKTQMASSSSGAENPSDRRVYVDPQDNNFPACWPESVGNIMKRSKTLTLGGDILLELEPPENQEIDEFWQENELIPKSECQIIDDAMPVEQKDYTLFGFFCPSPAVKKFHRGGWDNYEIWKLSDTLNGIPYAEAVKKFENHMESLGFNEQHEIVRTSYVGKSCIIILSALGFAAGLLLGYLQMTGQLVNGSMFDFGKQPPPPPTWNDVFMDFWNKIPGWN